MCRKLRPATEGDIIGVQQGSFENPGQASWIGGIDHAEDNSATESESGSDSGSFSDSGSSSYDTKSDADAPHADSAPDGVRAQSGGRTDGGLNAWLEEHPATLAYAAMRAQVRRSRCCSTMWIDTQFLPPPVQDPSLPARSPLEVVRFLATAPFLLTEVQRQAALLAEAGGRFNSAAFAHLGLGMPAPSSDSTSSTSKWLQSLATSTPAALGPSASFIGRPGTSSGSARPGSMQIQRLRSSRALDAPPSPRTFLNRALEQQQSHDDSLYIRIWQVSPTALHDPCVMLSLRQPAHASECRILDLRMKRPGFRLAPPLMHQR